MVQVLLLGSPGIEREDKSLKMAGLDHVVRMS